MPDDSHSEGHDAGKRQYLRRNHRKSRAGCQNCKRRRVKCDEQKPECRNCVRFSAKCDYQNTGQQSTYSPPSESKSLSPSPDGYATPPYRSRGRPRKVPITLKGDSASNNVDIAPRPVVSTPVTLPYSPPPNVTSLNADDLEYFFHYLHETSSSMAEEEGSRYMWRTSYIKVGFTHNFVLHFPLALSALHLSRSRPSRKDRYVLDAQRHYTAGIEQVSKILPVVDHSNCQALYVSGAFVCFYTFAQGPQPGDYLIFTDSGGCALWEPLLAGVREIMETVGSKIIFDGLGPPADVLLAEASARSSAAPGTKPRLLWKKPLMNLQNLVSSKTTVQGADRMELYIRAIQGMIPLFVASFTDDTDQATFDVEPSEYPVFQWLYTLNPNFVGLLRQKDSLALLVLAYFTVLLRTMEKLWFIEGWAPHILSGIKKFMGAEYFHWLQWPLEQGAQNKK